MAGEGRGGGGINGGEKKQKGEGRGSSSYFGLQRAYSLVEERWTISKQQIDECQNHALENKYIILK